MHVRGDESDLRIWHLATEREQIGPLTPAEVRARFASGQLCRAYAWREGFVEWLPLSAIRGFEDLAIPLPLPLPLPVPVAPEPTEARAAEISSLFDTLYKITSGTAWNETAQNLGDYLARKDLDVGDNTAMVDIRRLSRSYQDLLCPPIQLDPHAELAIGSSPELPIVAEAVIMSLPEPAPEKSEGLVRTLVAAAIALGLVTIILATLAASI